MRLRTMALWAGVLGIVVLAGGLVADAYRPERTVRPEVAFDSTVVVIDPEVLALAPEGRVGVSGSGNIEAHTARPVDAKAWLGDVSVTYVTGLSDWDSLVTRSADRVVASPSPSPTASPSASPSPSATPSPSPSAAADGVEEAEQFEVPAFMDASRDHWRETWNGTDRISVLTREVPAGLPLIVTSTTGAPLTQADLLIEREVNDGWISPLIWWGVILTVVGLLALVFYIVDLRPVQARIEESMARIRRRRARRAEPSPGSRRSRRRVPAAQVGADDDSDHDGDDDADTEVDSDSDQDSGDERPRHDKDDHDDKDDNGNKENKEERS